MLSAPVMTPPPMAFGKVRTAGSTLAVTPVTAVESLMARAFAMAEPSGFTVESVSSTVCVARTGLPLMVRSPAARPMTGTMTPVKVA